MLVERDEGGIMVLDNATLYTTNLIKKIDFSDMA